MHYEWAQEAEMHSKSREELLVSKTLEVVVPSGRAAKYEILETSKTTEAPS